MVLKKRFDMKKLIEKLEAFLELGGIKKDVTLLALSGALYGVCAKATREFYAKEGFIIVALGWILLSAMGALPFYISGEIPH